MKLKIFAIRDSKVEAFMRPYFASTTAEGMRIWDDSVNGDQTGFSRHPEDYCLFEIGIFDSEKGSIESYPQPKSLGLAVEFIKQQPNLSLAQAN